MLEETQLAYRCVPIDIMVGAQFEPNFVAISPNGRIPALVDHDGPGGSISIFESGAILVYLAEKTGRFEGRNSAERSAVLQWLFWQVGGLGPMAGQLSHFINYAPERNAYAIDRYRNEYERLVEVMDRRLEGRDWLAGEYSIADMASFPWLLPYRKFGIQLDRFGNVRRWYDRIKQRPPVRAAVELGSEWKSGADGMNEHARRILFNQR